MAVKSAKIKVVKTEEKPVVEAPKEVMKPSWHKDEAEEEGKLDPQEEKVLDWILKAVVAFILGWLGLSILMVIGGYFGIWK